MSRNTQNVGIIGAGLGGLATACTLAARGYPVVVFEKNGWVGGKAAILEAEGFRFDMGPTILTLPGVLKKVYAEAGKFLDDEIELIRLDPQWRCFFHDGSVLDLVEDIDAMQESLQEFTGDGQASTGYRDFIQMSKRLHEISDRFFLWKSVEDLRDTMDFKKNMDLDTLRDVLALRMGRSVAGTIRRHVRDKKISQMLDHFVQYVGSSPLASPAVLCSIAHMQTQDGVWYPQGGTRAVANGLEQLARSLGVEFRLGAKITRLTTANGSVTGLETDAGEQFHFSAVVSNMDSIRTYRELLNDKSLKPFKWRRDEPACSGVVLYLGLKERYAHLSHHNFVFSKDPEEEFDSIYKRGEPAADPSCYLAAPAITDPSVAPAGGDALYILVHTPYLRSHHDWEKMLPEYRRTIFKKLSVSAGMEDLEQRIVFESHLTPQDIHERYNVLKGAIYGLASHGKFFGAFKPGNRSRIARGLYLAGGAAHPGPGMPMVMMSGWIAADSLDQDFSGAATAQDLSA